MINKGEEIDVVNEAMCLFSIMHKIVIVTLFGTDVNTHASKHEILQEINQFETKVLTWFKTNEIDTTSFFAYFSNVKKILTCKI